jgi:hypothetical protein
MRETMKTARETQDKQETIKRKIDEKNVKR